MVIEKVVALELAKTLCEPSFIASNNLAHGHLRIVVGDPPGHTSKKLKRPDVPLPKRLRAFPLKGHHEHRVAKRQAHHQKRHLPQHPIHFHKRIPKVHLGLSRWMTQGHEHLLLVASHFPECILNHRVSARVTLVLQAFENTLGGVSLLFGQRLVLLEDLFHTPKVRAELFLLTRCRLPVTGRLRVVQHLLEGLPVQPGFSQDLSLADFFYQYSAAYFGPLFHIAQHPPV